MIRGTIVSIVLLAATLSALYRDPLDDGFPLSTYPMFASKRTTKLSVAYALGVRTDGTSYPLPSEVTGTGEVLQAAVVYEDAINHGRKALAALCTSIAAHAPDDVVTVRIVVGIHDAVELLVHDQRGTEHVRWQCPVKP